MKKRILVYGLIIAMLFITGCKKEHQHELVRHNGVDATCEESGYKAYDTCKNCEYTTYEEITPRGHDLIHLVGKDATCTEVGFNDHVTCKNCRYTTYEEIKVKGHKYEEDWTIDKSASYLEEGEKSKHCKNCEARDEVTIIPKLESASFVYEINSTNDGYIIKGVTTLYTVDVVIPDTYNNLPVVEIATGAFDYIDFNSVRIHKGIKKIGAVFYYNDSLKDVYYTGTFDDWCKIKMISDSSNPMIYATSFYLVDENNEYEELTIMNIPASMTNIYGYNFKGFDHVTSINIPATVKEITPGVFSYNTNLQKITVDENNPKYDSRNNCNAIIETSTNTLVLGCKKTLILSSITGIGDNAFEGCNSITSITLPDTITSIGTRAFAASSIEICNIPNTISYVGVGVFNECTNFKYNEYNDGYYIGNEENKYLALLEIKSTNVETFEIHKDTKIIASFAFIGCTNLTNITIPDKVEIICNYAFTYCTSLSSVVIPNSVTKIDAYAFEQCQSLKSIIIPSSVTYMGAGVFYLCENLIIYCEIEEQPSNWHSIWNYDNFEVVWGYKNN